MQSRFTQIENQLQEQNQQINNLHGRLQKLETASNSLPINNDNINDDNNDNNDFKENSFGYKSPSDIMYDNPMDNPECQNAILELEDIDIDKLIESHSKHIPCTHKQNWRPTIWTREGVGSLINHHCYRPHTPIRTTNDYNNIIQDGLSLSKKENGIDVPVYYHMPKCASSSTAGMLSDHFDFKQQWYDGPPSNHETVYTQCGFTFVRNPIERFISGYYTINNMLWRECLDDNGVKTFTNHTVQKYKEYDFIGIIGEPQRFEAYIDTMFTDPYHFGKVLPFRHTGSQMFFMSTWHGSDIHFWGRVEKYEDHFNQLMEFENCKWFKENMKQETEKIEVPNSMYHYGFYGPTLWRKANGEKKEYVDALGMRKTLEKMYSGKKNERVDANDILAPAYYFINERIYNKIVKYFYQDFVCFGYPTDFENFKKYVQGFVHPDDA